MQNETWTNRYAAELASANHAVTAAAFKEFVRAKNIVVVCPAKSVEGRRLGTFIDAHDIVVRLNMGYDFPAAGVVDFGRKSELCYHYLSLPNEFRRDYDLDEMKRRGVRFIVIPPRPENDHFEVFLQRNRSAGLPFVLFDEAMMRIVRQRIPGLPFLGVLAVAHLLRQPVASVHVVGMNFFETGHFVGYDGRTEQEQIAYAKNSQFDARGDAKRHFISPQKEFIRHLLLTDSRLTCDEELSSILCIAPQPPAVHLEQRNQGGNR